MTGNITGLRNAAAGAALAAGLVLGPVAVAHADPSLVPTPAPQPTVAAEGGAAAGVAAAAAAGAPKAAPDVLDVLAEEYGVGTGGGQLSNLLKVSLKLRAMGFKPSKQYLDEVRTAMNYRPNQLPLIDALKDTIAYQQKLKAQMDILTKAQSQQNPGNAVMGAGQMPAAGNPANVVPGAPAPGAPVPAPPIMQPMPPAP
ncbi:hypothetical protein [Mycolicibacterium sp.]|uniref:hypothetical protein n=1 Tax=Mycolicibacterium sp. TaxID=2320850 RepID=UPI0028AB5D42|nr:hypothetical protein [Mycolicibacterium sp.]